MTTFDKLKNQIINGSDDEVKCLYGHFKIMAHSFYGGMTEPDKSATELYYIARKEMLKRGLKYG